MKSEFKDAFSRVSMPEEGKMVDGNLIIAVKDARSIIGLTYHASGLLGEGTLRAVLVRAGGVFASEDVRRFASRGRQLVEEYLRWMSVTGWGMFHVENLEKNGGEVTCERSVFADEYPRGKKEGCLLLCRRDSANVDGICFRLQVHRQRNRVHSERRPKVQV